MHLLASEGSALIRGQGSLGGAKKKATGNGDGREKEQGEKWQDEIIPGLVALHVRRGDYEGRKQTSSPRPIH